MELVRIEGIELPKKVNSKIIGQKCVVQANPDCENFKITRQKRVGQGTDYREIKRERLVKTTALNSIRWRLEIMRR